MNSKQFLLSMAGVVVGFIILMIAMIVGANAHHATIKENSGWEEIPGPYGLDRLRIKDSGWLVCGGTGRTIFVPDSAGAWKIQEEENNEY